LPGAKEAEATVARYTRQQRFDAARRAGFDPKTAAIVTAISLGELGEQMDAATANDTRGVDPAVLAARGHSPEYSVGPMQINLLAHRGVTPQQASDLDFAMRFAYQLSKGGQDFRPWGAFTNGSYRQHLGGTVSLAPNLDPDGPNLDPGGPGGGGGASDQTDRLLAALGREPEWRTRGYPSYAAFVAAVGLRDAQESKHRDLQNLLATIEISRAGDQTELALQGLGLRREELQAQVADQIRRLQEDARQFDVSSGQSDRQLAARLGEDRRQFNERMGMDKAIFNTRFPEEQRQFNERLGFDRARFDTEFGEDRFRDRRNFGEDVFRDRRNFGEGQFRTDADIALQQNRQSFDYQNMLADLRKGPQDWVAYWYRSRGMLPPAGAEPVAIEDAVPAWAQPRELPTRAAATAAPAWADQVAAPAAAKAAPAPLATPQKTLDLAQTSSLAAPVATAAPPAWAKTGAAGMPQGAQLADYKGTPVSLSNYAVEQLRKNPAWAQGVR
jgi:hypothetical protein